AKLLLNTLWGKFGEKTKRTVTVSLDDPAKFWSLITDNGIEVTRFHMVHDDLEREKPVLGQLASEIEEGDHIVEFVCAGPKAYAYRTQRGTVECKVKGFHMNFTTSKRVHLEAMLELVQDEDEEKEGSYETMNAAASSPRKERIEQQMKILEEKHGESTMAPYCYKLWAEMLVKGFRRSRRHVQSYGYLLFDLKRPRPVVGLRHAIFFPWIGTRAEVYVKQRMDELILPWFDENGLADRTGQHLLTACWSLSLSID
ncbi:hypothetical protein QZH41_011354, partial [Actinostola sp. cb2023]